MLRPLLKQFSFLALLFLVLSCSKSDGDESPAGQLPASLAYSPASLSLSSGSAGSSAKPAISGTAPMSFTLTTSPASNGAITIESDGTIKAASSLAAGTYKVSVKASNQVGSAQFNDVYTITVTATTPAIPANLVYSPASATVTQGTAVSSAAPTITSSSAVTYTLSSVPALTAITINNQGIISATNALATGSYVISVTATNIAGSKLFSNVYTINVNAATATSVTYTNDIQGIIATNCGSCHINGPQLSFSNFTNVKNNITGILYRINLPSSDPGMMPQGGPKLSQAIIDKIQKWKDEGLKQ